MIESLGYTVMSRIDDVLYADSIARDPSLLEQTKKRLSLDVEPVKVLDAKLEIEKLNNMEGTQCMTLFDFMGWQEDQEAEVKSGKSMSTNLADILHESKLSKLSNIVTNKKVSYIEKLGNLGGLRSPTARH